MKRWLILISMLLYGLNLSAQDVWTLEKCINRAVDHSLTAKQALLGVSLEEINIQQAKRSRYPNLSAGIGVFEQFGRTIDPTTNSFANRTIGSSNYNISSGVLLFNAGRINQSIKQAKVNLEAAERTASATMDDLSLNVAMIYLQILFAEDQLDNANSRVEITQNQINQTEKLILAGSLPKNELLTLEAQLAGDEQNLIAAQNTLDNAYLQLKQVLLIDVAEDIRVDRPSLDLDEADPDLLLAEAIYQKALTTQDNIKAGELKVASAHIGEKIAKASLYPSISMSGSLSTNYSTLSKKVDGGQEVYFPQSVILDGDAAILEVPQLVPNLVDNPYSTQLDENFGQSVGLHLNIPIYQNGSSTAAVQRAKLNSIQTELSQQQTKQTLKSDIQSALGDARAAKKQYVAAQKSSTANQVAYENILKKYELGSAGSFELTTAKTNADIAKTQVISAKYDYLFKMKVLDYYQGIQIKF